MNAVAGPRSGWWRLLLAAAATALGLGLALPAAPASAHDILISTSPANGATVARVPSTVVLTFDNPALQPGTEQLVVTGPDGPVQQGPPALVNTTVTQPLRAGAPAGHYRVAWRATSVDGHPVSGQFDFTARAAGSGRSAPATATGSLPPGSSASASSSLSPLPGKAASARSVPVLPISAGVLVLLVGLVAWRLRSARPAPE